MGSENLVKSLCAIRIYLQQKPKKAPTPTPKLVSVYFYVS